jgi:spore coat polysaccharide biosynthesis protein SpsF (cytidylyltransferase family)
VTSLFKWTYSTAQKLKAAEALKVVLDTSEDYDKGQALQGLKEHPALFEPKSILSNLFTAYLEINKTKSNEDSEYKRNDAQFKSSKTA